MSIDYYLGVSSSAAITIYPEFDYKKDIVKDESAHRSRGVNLDLTVYKWGSHKKFSFGMKWVSDSDSQIMNEWWEDNTEVKFFIVDSAGDCTAYDVMIRNSSLPFQSTIAPYVDEYKGKLLLEEYS